MNLYEYLAMLRRRWLVLAVAGVCTLGLLGLVHGRTISYTGCTTVILQPSPAEQANVLLDVNPSVAIMTGAAVVKVSSPDMQEKLTSLGVAAGYQVTQENTGTPEVPAYAQPLLQICEKAASPQVVTDSIGKVLAAFRSTLLQLQVSEHVRSGARITSAVLVPASALPVTGRPSEAYLAVLLIGLCSGLAVAGWLDPWLERRRSGHRRARS